MKKILTKKQILEVVDGNSNLIGDEDNTIPVNDKKSTSNLTTDKVARIGHQNYQNDFLGRFGFTFYESEDDGNELLMKLSSIMYDKFLETLKYYYEKPDLLGADYKEHFDNNVKKQDKIDGTDQKWANKILDTIKPYMKKDINESDVVEDKIVKKDKKPDPLKAKDKDNEIIQKDRVEKISNLLSKLPKDSLDKLIGLLEKKIK